MTSPLIPDETTGPTLTRDPLIPKLHPFDEVEHPNHPGTVWVVDWTTPAGQVHAYSTIDPTRICRFLAAEMRVLRRAREVFAAKPPEEKVFELSLAAHDTFASSPRNSASRFQAFLEVYGFTIKHGGHVFDPTGQHVVQGLGAMANRLLHDPSLIRAIVDAGPAPEPIVADDRIQAAQDLAARVLTGRDSAVIGFQHLLEVAGRERPADDAELARMAEAMTEYAAAEKFIVDLDEAQRLDPEPPVADRPGLAPFATQLRTAVTTEIPLPTAVRVLRHLITTLREGISISAEEAADQVEALVDLIDPHAPGDDPRDDAAVLEAAIRRESLKVISDLGLEDVGSDDRELDAVLQRATAKLERKPDPGSPA